MSWKTVNNGDEICGNTASKNSGALLNRKQVEGIRTWIPEFSDKEQELLQASEQHYWEEERQEAARRRLKKLSLYGAAAFMVIVMRLGIFSWFQKREADKQREMAERNQARVLAALANSEVDAGSPATAIRMALAVAPQDLAKPLLIYAREAEGALFHALLQLRELGRIGHEAPVTSVAFSPDGKLLATGSEGTARLWEVTTGKEIAALRGHEAELSSVAFSPDGRTLATGSEGIARLWEVASGRKVAILRHPEFADVNSVAFSPDGKLLATAGKRTVRLWDVASGKDIVVLSEPQGVAPGADEGSRPPFFHTTIREDRVPFPGGTVPDGRLPAGFLRNINHQLILPKGHQRRRRRSLR